jgi:2-phosphosulfolactate phosphatase
MEITRHSLLEGVREAEGLVVVLDVFRAFTCAPLLFHFGVERIFLVSKPEEGLALKSHDPGLILVGELGGAPIEGFDLGNSPSAILRAGRGRFTGKTVVQRTSSGVQGVIAALERAEEVLLGSYTLAKGTADYIRRKNPARVSIVAMGWQMEQIAPEDEWCAGYLNHLLDGSFYDHHEALLAILFDHSAQKFLRGQTPHFPPEDPVLCLQRDLYDFVLKAYNENDRVVVRKYAASPSES